MAVPRELELRIVPQALPVSAGLAGLAALAGFLGWTPLALLALTLALANLAFFRNPRRSSPEGERQVVSPGDGRVMEVVRLEAPDEFVGPCWRVAIFLSVFDVHINRSPLSGKVRAVRRAGSGFRAAFRREASDHNVQVRVDLESPDGIRLGVVQITGWIARRIICHAGVGGTLLRGEAYGLICYGSRVEVLLPGRSQLRVKPGDRVRGGESILAEVPE